MRGGNRGVGKNKKKKKKKKTKKKKKEGWEQGGREIENTGCRVHQCLLLNWSLFSCPVYSNTYDLTLMILLGYQPPEGKSSLHAFTYSTTTILSYTVTPGLGVCFVNEEP